MTQEDTAEIERLLVQNLEALLARFWPGHVVRGKMAYCAPANKADLGSFVVYLGPQGKRTRGEWNRFSQAIGGDTINLFAYGLSGEGSHRADKDTFNEIRRFLGLDSSKPVTAEERERLEAAQRAAAEKRAADDRRAAEQDRARMQTAGGIWMECIAIARTLAEAYLMDRGIPVPPEGWYDSLRFHPGLPLFPGEPLSNLNQVFPCLVCRVDDVFGDLVAIWRIYLDPKKPTKAPIRDPKMGFGPAAGGAIRLGGIAEHIGASEGAETAMGAHALIKYRHPVWAMMSTSGLIGFEVPMEVELITGFPDGDKPWKKDGEDIVLAEPAGRAAMRKLGERVRLIDKRFDPQPEPRIRTDYLDVWNARVRAEARA